MSTVTALALPLDTSWAATDPLPCRPTAAVLLAASTRSTVPSANTTSGPSSRQLTLALTTGWHVGPLFIVQKRRAPLIHGGTSGGRRRRAREVRATPKWLTPEQIAKIRAIYK